MRKPFEGFVGGSGQRAYSPVANSERTINWYPEMPAGSNKDRSINSLKSTPGYKGQSFLSTGNAGPVWGLGTTTRVQTGGVSTSELTFAIMGTIAGQCRLVQFQNNGSAPADLGATQFPSNVGPIRMIFGNTQLVAISIQSSSTTGLLYDFSTSTLSSITPLNPGQGGWVNPIDGDFLDGYFIFAAAGSEKFFISGVNDGSTYSALDFALESDIPDKLVGCRVSNRRLWLFGTRRMQAWYNSGATDFPFSRDNSGTIEVGAINAACIQKNAGTLMWLGRQGNADIRCYRLNGYNAVPVSTPAQETYWATQDVTKCIAWSYSEEGHDFYCVSFTGSNVPTQVYDASTGEWHERGVFTSSGDFNTGTFGAEPVSGATFNPNLGGLIVGYANGGSCFQYNRRIFSYSDGNAIFRKRTFPHLYQGGSRNFYNEAVIDIENRAAGAPASLLRYSNDFGRTFTQYATPTASNPGSGLSRVRWMRLGSAQTDRVFDLLTYDSAGEVNAYGAMLDVDGGVA